MKYDGNYILCDNIKTMIFLSKSEPNSNRIESNISLIESSRFRIVSSRGNVESNRIEYDLNRIEPNRFEIFKKQVESNRIEYRFSRIESNPNGDFLIRFGLWYVMSQTKHACSQIARHVLDISRQK